MPRGRILAAAFLAFAAGAARCAPPPKDDGCQPGPGQVALFGAPNFAPPCTLFGPGELAGTEAIVHAGKPARSLRVGPQSESLACRLNTSGRAQCSDARSDPFLPAGDQAIALLRIARWPVRAEACEPAPEELVVVSDRERRLCARLKPGNLASPAELGWGDDDNFGRPEPAAEIERRRRGGQLMHSADIGRVRAGSRVKARLCDRADFGGNCWSMQPGGYQLAARPPVRSVQVLRDCPVTSGEAVVHAQDGFWGLCVRLPVGRHESIAALRLEGRAARGVQVGRDVTVTACSEEGLKGDCAELAPGSSLDARELRSLAIVRAVRTPAASASAPAEGR